MRRRSRGLEKYIDTKIKKVHLQPEHEKVDTQDYSSKFYGKKLMGNQDFCNNYSTENVS